MHKSMVSGILKNNKRICSCYVKYQYSKATNNSIKPKMVQMNWTTFQIFIKLFQRTIF